MMDECVITTIGDTVTCVRTEGTTQTSHSLPSRWTVYHARFEYGPRTGSIYGIRRRLHVDRVTLHSNHYLDVSETEMNAKTKVVSFAA